MVMYVGFFKRLETTVVKEVRMMTAYCMTDMRTNTAKNILRICDEFGLSLDTISPPRVKEAYIAQLSLDQAKSKQS